jgi:hypothetical protein
VIITVTDETIRSYFIDSSARHPDITDAVAGKNTHGYPTSFLNIMGHDAIAYLSGRQDYKKNPVEVYRAMEIALGVDLLTSGYPKILFQWEIRVLKTPVTTPLPEPGKS